MTMTMNAFMIGSAQIVNTSVWMDHAFGILIARNALIIGIVQQITFVRMDHAFMIMGKKMARSVIAILNVQVILVFVTLALAQGFTVPAAESVTRVIFARKQTNMATNMATMVFALFRTMVSMIRAKMKAIVGNMSCARTGNVLTQNVILMRIVMINLFVLSTFAVRNSILMRLNASHVMKCSPVVMH
jgi:hypothetical protein